MLFFQKKEISETTLAAGESLAIGPIGLGVAQGIFSIQLRLTGGAGSVDVELHGSNDGVDFMLGEGQSALGEAKNISSGPNSNGKLRLDADSDTMPISPDLKVVITEKSGAPITVAGTICWR